MEENLFDEDIVAETPKGEKPVKQYIVVGYQVIRIVSKISLGTKISERLILDTIMVEGGKTEYAKNTAVDKAKYLGNCMVIELCERSVIAITEQANMSNTILYRQGRKKVRRNIR